MVGPSFRERRWRRALGMLATATLFGLGGCGSGGCTPGENVACTCANGGSETARCNDQGEAVCLCGQGNNPGATSSGTYDWSADDAVLVDSKTGLMWQRHVEDKTFHWEGAKLYCDGLSLAGYDDWLLPHKDDLLSIVLLTTSTPAIDAVAFPKTPAKPFWTRTLYAPRAQTDAWGVDFEDGGEGYAAFVEQHYARCVRQP
ncbi:MAG: hypothetical protein RIT45_2845 [Pseudomonadota bacterium]